VVAAGVVLALAACGSRGPARDLARMDRAFETSPPELRTVAPDVWAEAEEERRSARRAQARGDRGLAAHHAVQARMLIDLGAAQRDLARARQRRLEAERSIREARLDASRYEAERTAAALSSRRVLAVQAARRALRAAQRREARRSPAAARERAAARIALARELLTRARTDVSAASAMGSGDGDETLAAIRAAIEAAAAQDPGDRPRNPTTAGPFLDAARRAADAARRALERASSVPAPAAAEGEG
jgi:hypothetical protein